MLKKIKKWFTPKTKTKLGRPKLAKKSVLKAARVELALAFVLVATVALAGTSTLTGRSPLDLLSFGLASKASGNALVGGGSVDLTCGSLGTIGSYKISSSSTAQTKDYSTSHIGISSIPKVWVKSTNFNVNAATGTSTNSSFYVNIIRYELKNRAGTVICNGQFYNAGNDLKYKQINVNVSINKGTFYAAINASADVKNKTTNVIHTADTSAGGHYSSEGLRIDNTAPTASGSKILVSSNSAYSYKVQTTINDGGELNGYIVYNIYRYDFLLGKQTGSYLHSEREDFNNKGTQTNWIKYFSGTTTTKGQYLTQQDGTIKYPFILVGSIVDNAGNRGSDIKICYLVDKNGINPAMFSCGTTKTFTLTPSSKTITKTVGNKFSITANMNPSYETVTWKNSNPSVASETSKTSKGINLTAAKAGTATITATSRTGQTRSITVVVRAATTTVSGTTTKPGTTKSSTTTKPGTTKPGTTKPGTTAPRTTTVTRTTKKQVDVSQIVGGVVITITPDTTYDYTPIKYGNRVPIHTTFTRTPTNIPARYRKWYTYYKNNASDKWILNWGTKDSTTGNFGPCTLVKDTVGASPTLSINYKYRVGKWSIFSDSKCTKHLGSVLTPVYTGY